MTLVFSLLALVRVFLLAVATAIGLLVFSASGAFAVSDMVDGGPVNGAEQADWLSLSDATNTVRLIGILIPIATALVTKHVASDRVKALTTLVFSVLVSTVAVLAGNDGAYHWQEFVNAFVNTFVPAIAAYYGLLKPVGVTPAVSRATRGFGIGSEDRRAA